MIGEKYDEREKFSFGEDEKKKKKKGGGGVVLYTFVVYISSVYLSSNCLYALYLSILLNIL